MADITEFNINDGSFTLTTYTVATLPDVAKVPKGVRFIVTDSDTGEVTGRGKTVVGGGGYRVKVRESNGGYRIDG